jgi:cell division protease FtsH
MVVRYGMSPKVGGLSLVDDGDSPGQSLTLTRAYSEETAALIDEEVRRICEECLHQAVVLLTDNRAKLDALVKELLLHDTLGEAEILAVTGIEAPAAPAAVAQR